MDLSKQFDTCLALSNLDPAIDAERIEEVIDGKSRIERFYALRDVESLPLKEGMQPVTFTLRPLGARELNALLSSTNPVDVPPSELWTVVQRCLVAVKNDADFALTEDDFQVIDAARGTKMLKSDAMDRLAAQYGLNGVRELGRAVVQRAAPPARVLAPFASPRG